MVRAPGASGFKSFSLPLVGFVSGSPKFNSSTLCIKPTAAFHQLGFLASFWVIYNICLLFSVSSISTVLLNTTTLNKVISFYFIYFFFFSCMVFFCSALVHIDSCRHNPCHNGGRCTRLRHGRFRCICHRGYSGRLCTGMSYKYIMCYAS